MWGVLDPYHSLARVRQTGMSVLLNEEPNVDRNI